MDVLSIAPVRIETLQRTALAPLHRVADARLNEKQMELAETIFLGIQNSPAAHVLEAEAAAYCAMVVLVQICHVFGGAAYYFSTLGNVRTADMNEAIRGEFSGNNHAVLAKKYGITEMRVRQILAGTGKKGKQHAG